MVKQILVLAIVFIIGCSSNSENNPLESEPASLLGKWKTRGIEPVNIANNVGIQGEIEFTETLWKYKLTFFRNQNGGWVLQYPDPIDSGNFIYIIDNNFIKRFDEYGASGDDGYIFHYSIDGDKLTLNAAWDGGGIFEGTSNSLTNNLWVNKQTYFDTLDNKLYSRFRKYLFNEDGSGIIFWENSQWNENGSKNIKYSINNKTLTFFDEGYVEPDYVAIYEIKDKKLYLYGKPGTSDNDDYWEYIFYRN